MSVIEPDNSVPEKTFESLAIPLRGVTCKVEPSIRVTHYGNYSDLREQSTQ